MVCSSVTTGKVGRQVYMSAVYEGSTELQLISENAIFGDATPCGNLRLTGDVPNPFAEGEEYYLDLFAPTEQWQRDGAQLELQAQKVFRSAVDPNFPTGHVTFRFALGFEGGVAGELDMAIANPAAVEALDDSRYFRFVVRLARYRASDKEIDIRAGLLADAEAYYGKEWDKPEPSKSTWQYAAWRKISGAPDAAQCTREEYIAHYTRDLRRKLAIAKGEITD
jgi:hypothetical protein